MGQIRRQAGILQYSKPVYDRIKDHVTAVFATFMTANLHQAVAQSDQTLRRVQAKFREIQSLIDELHDFLEEDPYGEGAHQATIQLLNEVQRWAGQGTLDRFNLRPANLFGTPVQRLQETRIIGRAFEQVGREASRALKDDAQELKDDIQKWEKHLDPDILQRAMDQVQQGRPPTALDLTLKLKPEDFPFLGEEFQKSVEKVRGPGAKMLDDIPEIHVKIRNLGPGMAGAWDSKDSTLMVGLPGLVKYDGARESLHTTLTHELRHMTQTVMSKALGVDQYLLDKDGNLIPQYKAGPGMPPRKLLNLDIMQAIPRAVGQMPELKERRKNLMLQHQLADDTAFYNLDDIEFYTHIADRSLDFERLLKKKTNWTPDQVKLATKIFTGDMEIPQRITKRLAWVRKHDPMMTVVNTVRGHDTFFGHLLKHKPEKWRKAVKEFTKEISKHTKEEAPKKDSLQELWQMFLEEKYDGGKAKVQNPNPKTRDSNPEISVNYLMRKTEPAYQAGRKKIRSEFARWRATKVPRPARPQAPSQSPGLGQAPPRRREQRNQSPGLGQAPPRRRKR